MLLDEGPQISEIEISRILIGHLVSPKRGEAPKSGAREASLY